MSVRATNLVKVVWLKREEQIKAPKWPLDWETTKTSFATYLKTVLYTVTCVELLFVKNAET